MKKHRFFALLFCVLLSLSGCGEEQNPAVPAEPNTSNAVVHNREEEAMMTNQISEMFTQDSTVGNVINHPAFKSFGRLLFPVDRMVTEGMTLPQGC